MNESSGLDPSVYGGGGSPSSSPLLEDSPLLVEDSFALSAAALHSASSSASASSKEGAGAVARRHSDIDSVTAAFIRCSSESGGKYSDEKGGGFGEDGPEFDASGCGGGGS